ncbi:MAG: DUF4097 family beta strand repeat-containing protein [Candidatus Saccharicenans sp.]|nr:DUF4097 family beta strand repeat-containing protein [Candidatus Saccharicenans sp.]MDI6848796.1 DUF4097 family beta strand repeat-containing protein [Candidatus Saccharicenans sp.]
MIKRDWRRLKGLKSGLMLVLGLLLVLPLMAGEEYQEKFERTEKLSRDGLVAVNNVSGDIRIMVWKEEKVKIEAVKYSRASSQPKAKENADKVKIEVTAGPGLVRIETKYPESRKWFGGDSNVSVDYTLWIPDKASIETRSVSGDVEVEKAGGAVRVSAVSGSLSLVGGTGTISAKTVSGNVRITEAGGDCELNSVSGDIYLNRARGSVEAEVVSGTVKLLDITEARRVSAKSVSGNVEYRGQVLPGGVYRFTSHSGEVRLFLPGDSSFDLEASSFSGSVTTDFPVQVIGKLSGKTIQGRVGKGGAEVQAKAFSGSVEIRKGS